MTKEPIIITGDRVDGKSVLIAEIPKGKRLEELNEAQNAHVETVKQLWLDYFFSCKNQVNKEAASIGIEWMYKLAGLERPIIIYLDSPMACQYAIPYLKEIMNVLPPSFSRNLDQVRAQVRAQVGDQVWAQVGDQVGDQVWAQVGAQVGDQVGAQVRAQVWAQVGDQVGDQVWAQVGDQVGDQVWDQVWAQVRDQVWAQVRDQVWDQVGDQVWAQVRAQVGAQVDSQKLSYESFCSYGSVADFGWISFFDFFHQIGVLNHDDFVQFKNLIQSGIYDMIQLNGFCIVSNLPSTIHRDAANRLHSVEGAAIEFRDGYSQYFIHGVGIKQDMYQRLISKEFTFQDWVKEDNEEIKSAVLSFMEEKWGSEYLFRFISDNLKEVNTYTDKKPGQYLEGTTGGMNIGVYTLFKGKLNNINLAFVRCYCPSTDRMFFLSVDPVHKNANDAIASLYRVPKKLKGEIKYIQRQGERFSTVFTDEGNAVLSTLSKEDIEDLTTISGDEYFSKMKYEY